MTRKNGRTSIAATLVALLCGGIAAPAAASTLLPSQSVPSTSPAALAAPAVAGPAVTSDVPQPFAEPSFALTLTVDSDGTPDWDPDDGPGNDSGPSNGIVRVNDIVTYRVQYAVNGDPAEATTLTVTLPQGMQIDTMPGYCLAPGSSLSPQVVPNPAPPLDSTTVTRLEQQTLVCDLGPKTNVSESVTFSARVLGHVPHAHELTIAGAGITAANTSTEVAASILPTVTATARLQWDISKNGIATQENSGYVGGPNDVACSWDNSLVCKRTEYPILIGAPSNGKGAMPATGTISFVDDLSASAIFPDLSAAQIAAIDADPQTYGTRVTACGADVVPNQRPAAQIGYGGASAVNAVADSGTCAFSQPQPGQPATISISGFDATLRTVPSEVALPAGQALPADMAYIVSLGLRIETPVATIQEFGAQSGNSWVLPTRNAYTDLSVTGLSPSDQQTSAGQPTWNDYRDTTQRVEVGSSMRVDFMGAPGDSTNMSSETYTPSFESRGEGPAGGATIQSGQVTVVPGQTVTSQMLFTGSRPSFPAAVSFVGCDAWDPTQLHLRAADYGPPVVSSGARFQRLPSEGDAVWMSGFLGTGATSSGWADTRAQTPGLRVQYAAAPGGSGADSSCGDDMGPWFDEPGHVPGNDPALAAEGVFTAVSRVRVHFVLPEPPSNGAAFTNGVRAAVSIGLRVADDVAIGDVLGTWGGGLRINSASADMAEVLARGFGDTSTYAASDHTGELGDRLTVTSAHARIDKTVRRGDTGEFAKTPPAVSGGDRVDFRLAPSFTNPTGRTTTETMWIEDCIPAALTYVDSSLTPALVAVGSTPADAQRPACGAGETYARWVLPDVASNTTIVPIDGTTSVSGTADDGTYTNTVVVSANDTSALELRRSEAQVHVSNVQGFALEQVALTPVVQVNRDDAAEVERNVWRVTLTNTTSEAATGAEVINLLPHRDSNGSRASGMIRFDAIDVIAGAEDVRLEYSATESVVSDPTDASNLPGGSTTWCDALTGGTPVSGSGACPDDAGQVTAVRLIKDGMLQAGTAIAYEVAVVASDSRGGDVFVNRVSAGVGGMDFAVGPIDRAQTVVESSIGDVAWWDLNRNGRQDDMAGSPEPGAAGVTVRISGVDDLGNVVDVGTETDSSGRYEFGQLRSADGDGYVVTFTLPHAASGFTVRLADEPDAVASAVSGTSVVDPETGATDPILLASNTADTTIDAGLLADGSVQISKVLSGAGVQFAAADTLLFDVGCTLLGESVYSAEVSLTVDGATAITSDALGPIPVLSECLVTEIDAGNADSVAAPVTVTVPWDGTDQTTEPVVASLTNYYSAGTVAVEKTLDGDGERLAQVQDRQFVIQVTCQVREPSAEGSVLATLHSSAVHLRGGESVTVRTSDGEDLLLPLGARCFTEETDAGGADISEDRYADFESGAEVTGGRPAVLQALVLPVTNTFHCDATTCPDPAAGGAPTADSPEALARTGVQIAFALAFALLLGALGLALRRRA